MFVLGSISNDILPLWEPELSIGGNIGFNKRPWNESESDPDLRAGLASSKTSILLDLITYSILLGFS